MSSSFGGGAGGGDTDSFCEGLSVDAVVALPLRCRILYFSIASASRSRIRVAIGDRADAGFEAPFGRRVAELGCDIGDAANPKVLVEELADGWPAECVAEGNGAGRREGEDQNLEEDCAGADSTTSPLSEVVVVRLVPDPLRIRTDPLLANTYSLGEGGYTCMAAVAAVLAQSVPLAAACWKTFRRAFLLFSNCIRAVSCKVSLVLILHRKRDEPSATADVRIY